jgi:hypothetical protein
MTDGERGDNVWGSPGPAAGSPQRWPGRPEADRVPRSTAETVAPGRPSRPSGATVHRAAADLAAWGGLALGALLLLLLGFALWDRPVEPPIQPSTVVSTGEASDGS